MTDKLDADRTAEDDRVEKRDEAYAIAQAEAKARQQQAEDQAEADEAQQQTQKTQPPKSTKS
jgi:hypothetical protein